MEILSLCLIPVFLLPLVLGKEVGLSICSGDTSFTEEYILNMDICTLCS